MAIEMPIVRELMSLLYPPPYRFPPLATPPPPYWLQDYRPGLLSTLLGIPEAIPPTVFPYDVEVAKRLTAERDAVRRAMAAEAMEEILANIGVKLPEDFLESPAGKLLAGLGLSGIGRLGGILGYAPWTEAAELPEAVAEIKRHLPRDKKKLDVKKMIKELKNLGVLGRFSPREVKDIIRLTHKGMPGFAIDEKQQARQIKDVSDIIDLGAKAFGMMDKEQILQKAQRIGGAGAPADNIKKTLLYTAALDRALDLPQGSAAATAELGAEVFERHELLPELGANFALKLLPLRMPNFLKEQKDAHRSRSS